MQTSRNARPAPRGVMLALYAASSLAAAAAPPGLKMRETAAGRYYQDARSLPLYVYAQDSTPGKSACNGPCAKAWPPFAAAADLPVTVAAGPWSTIKREDGTRQWALRGRPLYTYAKDAEPGNPPGNALGDRVGNAWSLAFDPVRMPPGYTARALYLGRVLADARGRTLYWRRDEAPSEKPGAAPSDARRTTPPKSKCRGACLERWNPVTAPQLANPIGDWAPAARDDGILQWTFRGRRLYTDETEFKAGQTLGQGADEVWEVALLEPAAPLPAWVTVQNADMGEIYADAKGMTLYTFGGAALERTRALICDDACLAKNWQPVIAAPDAQPSGEWTIIGAEPGTPNVRAGARVWAYKGSALYTHTRDRVPGGVGGDKWAVGAGGFGGFNPIPYRRDLDEE